MCVSTLSGTFPAGAAITLRMRSQADTPDDDLMRRTAAGDREAFDALYRRHGATVYRFARLMTGCDSAAEDIVQDAFLSLMRDAARYDPGRASLPTYLYGMARHQTRRRLLRDRRFVELSHACENSADEDDPAGHLARAENLRLLRQAILGLPSRYREVIVLCDLQDVSYADAAAVLECALGTVRSRLHRGRHLLAEKMLRAQRPATHSTMRCAV
jgi:RNA polymerase sigma-70 factor, ECF subfamily